MTGGTLYEAVEPHALWNRLLSVIMSDLDSPNEVKYGKSCASTLVFTAGVGLWDGQVPPDEVPRT